MSQKLPSEFKKRMRDILGEEYDAFEAAFEASEPVRALRVNTLKMSLEHFSEICDISVAPIGHCAEGFRFDAEHIGSHPLHMSGAIYVQEPGAMTPIECVEIEAGMTVLDVCAAPGGKTSQAAAKLGGTGVVVTNEIDGKRVGILCQNLERLGVRNAVVLNTDSSVLGETYKRAFDLVIADVPCSGEGMMRKNPLAVSEWSVENIKMCAERQREIMRNIGDCVAEGGTLLYSTCTFAPEENECIIRDFLSEHPDFSLADVPKKIKNATSDGIALDGDETLKKCRRFYPHVSGGEGQFAAVLIRDGERTELSKSRPDVGEKKRKKDNGGKQKNDRNTAEEPLIRDFIADVLDEDGQAATQSMVLIKRGEYWYLCPNFSVPDSAECVKLPGVPIGSVVKGRVVPHHGFFSAYGGFFRIKIDLDASDERLGRYLHGEEIETDNDTENGFAAVLFSGAPIGGAKVLSHRAKNYFPKGLRI